MLARDEMLQPDAVRRPTPLTAFLVVLPAVLVAFATALFAADRLDRAPVFRFAALAVRRTSLAVRFAVVVARLTVLGDRFAALLARLAGVGAREAFLALCGVDVTALVAVFAPRVAPLAVFLPPLVARLAAAVALDAARLERCVIVNRIWSPTAL